MEVDVSHIRRIAGFMAALICVTSGLTVSGVAVESAGAADSTTSFTWAGFLLQNASSGNFYGVSSTWTVPKIRCLKGENSNVEEWVGLGGQLPRGSNPEKLYQTGIRSSCVKGKSAYSAFEQTYQNIGDGVAGTSVGKKVKAGDSITASVVEGKKFKVRYTITDNRSGSKQWAASGTWKALHKGFHSAECIVENPLSTKTGKSNPTGLSNFGTASFSSCQASDPQGTFWRMDASTLPASWSFLELSMKPKNQIIATPSVNPLTVTWTATSATELAFQNSQANGITDTLGALWASSGVVVKSGADWLATAYIPGAPDIDSKTIVSTYRWAGTTWEGQGQVHLPFGDTGSLSGPPGNSGQLTTASLTGSTSPDFLLNTSGADTHWFSVISDLGGSWQAVPFDYGNGPTIGIDAKGPSGPLVEAQANSCGCASGIETYSWYQFQAGTFRIVSPPGPQPPCDSQTLTNTLSNSPSPGSPGDVAVAKEACSDGWALASGTSSAGTFVALFQQEGTTWIDVTLDDGGFLGNDPTMYAIPLSLLTQLNSEIGGDPISRLSHFSTSLTVPA
jgi:hypothetical protein